MNIKALLDAYSRSHFDVFLPADRILTPAQKKAAEADYNRDPARALMENVEAARDDVRFTGERLQRAMRDGLFEETIFKAATKDERKRLIAAMATVRGDFVRAKSELAHWRGYVQWATEKQRAKVSRLEASEPDRRLPPEAA